MLSARIVRDDKGLSKGIAYVDVETREMAQKCLVLDQTELKAKKLSVKLSAPPSAGEKDACTVYVNNLSFGVTREEMEKLFSGYGTIKDVRIIKDQRTGKAKGFAYVEFETTEAAKAALALNRTKFGERVIQVLPSMSDKKKREGVGPVVHVNNLSFEADENDLIVFFEKNIGKDCVFKAAIARDNDVRIIL